MKTKAVPRGWLERDGRRLDCGPYMSGALEAKVLLEVLRATKVPLQDVCLGGRGGLVNAGRIKRLWVTDERHGIRFLSSTDILKADLSNLQIISKQAARSNPKLLIQSGWTLITRAGTIGRMAYARPDMGGLACSEDVLRVIPDPEKIPPGYLYAYLSSKFGVPLVVGGTYGAVIQHIEPVHVNSLPVPRLGVEVESRANELVNRGANLLAEYQSSIKAATARVFAGTGIWNPSSFDWFRDKSDLGFAVGAQSLDILRAWNHSRRAERIKALIRSGPWARLGDVTEFEWMRWRKLFQRIDAEPEFGVEVITQRPLFNLFPEGRWLSRKYLGQHSPKYWVPDQTILIAKQGTFGEGEVYCRCEFITGKRMLARAYSDHCMRIVVRDGAIHPGYLFAFLRSEAAFRLLRSLSEGAKQQDLHWRTVPELPVPRHDPVDERSIGESVLQAYRYRNDAVELLLDAVRLVEDGIEKGVN
jgi:hypothetical protein